MGDQRNDDRHVIRLAVPADVQFVPLVRLTASGVASRVGLSIDEVDDIRIAVDELMTIALEDADINGYTDLEFELGDGVLTVRGSVATNAVVSPTVPELTERILEAVVDRYEVGTDDDRLTFSLEKRTGSND